MTTVRAKFILWLIVLAAVLGAIRCPGQTSAVQFNTSTGAVVEPSAGATPLIGRAGFQEFTADANGTILATTSYAEWNVPTQSATRYLTLPTVGTDAGEFAPGRELVISVVASNDEGVLDLDELYFTATTPTIFRLQAKSDGTWRVLESVTFTSLARLAAGLGTAANATLGTSGSTVPLNNGNNVFSGRNRHTDATQTPSNLTGTYLGGYLRGFGMVFVDSSAPANERIYDVTGTPLDSGGLSWRAVNDAYSAADTYLKISRTGATIDSTEITMSKAGPAGSVFKNIYHKTDTLSGGTITITDANIGATDIIIPVGTGGTNAGSLYVDSISDGASFTITSTNASDARAIKCIIFDLP